jgi:phosphoribosylformylglycinamidine synthase|tara:strand:- start:225 stop:506 length:282 start_codon:yes stop_codon:yes gene_type:complete
VTRYQLEVRVVPRTGLLDPPGKAIHHALHSLGYLGVEDVRVGKTIFLQIDAPSGREARGRAEEMCRKLLSNPVTEDYEVSVLGEGEVQDGTDS